MIRRSQLSVLLIGTKDLSIAYSLTLILYGSDFGWEIRAEQPMERYFTLSGQIGESGDRCRKLGVSWFRYHGDRSSGMSVTSMKLGPEGSATYNPAISSLRNFCESCRLDVFL